MATFIKAESHTLQPFGLLRHVALTSSRQRGVKLADRKQTELGYRCWTEACRWGDTPDVARIRAYFHLISFSIKSWTFWFHQEQARFCTDVYPGKHVAHAKSHQLPPPWSFQLWVPLLWDCLIIRYWFDDIKSWREFCFMSKHHFWTGPMIENEQLMSITDM